METRIIEYLPGVLVIRIDRHEDFRGTYTEIYNKAYYSEHLACYRKYPDIEFVCDDYSVSSQHVLRGIHGDAVTWKLISCLHGRIYLAVVNCDDSSDHFGKWDSFVLSPENALQVLVPPKYGNAHLVLSDTAIFHYKQSEYYNREGQFTYRYDDPRFNIWWPIKKPLLSQRDEGE